MVHRELTGGFLSVTCMRASTLDNVQLDQLDGTQAVIDGITLRITIGTQNIALITDVQADAKKLFENLWIEAGEEVWISTSAPNRLAVFGTISYNEKK
jgi:hypothetical protein